MKKGGLLFTATVLAFVLMCAAPAFGEMSQAELAKQSEQAAAASSGTKPTPEMIKKKVNSACEMLQSEGESALRKLQGSDSNYIFSGTYIWVHDMQGNMVMHPIKYQLNGKNIIGLKDAKGKLFFAEMNQVAQDKGQGWISYMWPKPGEKTASEKVSFVKQCPVEGHKLVLGCGVYDISMDEVKASQ
jgi:signal transduction histidine kinase